MTGSKIDELEKRVAALEALVENIQGTAASQESTANDALMPNWSLNERAFVGRYAQGKSGEKKFTLLVAYLAKGNFEVAVSLSDIQKLWSNMTAKTLLGSKFNTKYPTVAKTNGWINNPKKGTYQLTLGWDEVLTNGRTSN